MQIQNTQIFSHYKLFSILLGPLLALGLLLTEPPADMPVLAWHVVAISCWMVAWWLTEAAPIATTALLPVIIFPLLEISSIKDAAAPYMSPVIFLMMGGFMIAVAMEHWQLHVRIALHLLKLIGTNTNRIVAGFMVTTAILSMWISNTATVVMMLPIAFSVIKLVEDHAVKQKRVKLDHFFATSLVLAIAYSASIGGVGTIIGTPPNAILYGIMQEKHQMEIDFVDWMLVGIPFVIVTCTITWFLLVKVLFPNKLHSNIDARSVIDKEIIGLGPLTKPEKLVAFVFVLTASLWIFRGIINDLLPVGSLSNAGVAMIGAFLLFILPVDLQKKSFVLDWRIAQKVRWDVLILLGGGLSLAKALNDTGLAAWIGNHISALGDIEFYVILIAIVATIVFMTELMSNTATTTAFLPIIITFSTTIGQGPLTFAIPATIAASCAFMMPIATAPNAVAYSSGYIRIQQMLKAGFWLNLLAIMVISLVVHQLAKVVF